MIILSMEGKLIPVFSVLLAQRVVGGLLGDYDVVNVAFPQTGCGDPNESAFAAQIFDCTAARISHPRAKTSQQLIEDV